MIPTRENLIGRWSFWCKMRALSEKYALLYMCSTVAPIQYFTTWRDVAAILLGEMQQCTHRLFTNSTCTQLFPLESGSAEVLLSSVYYGWGCGFRHDDTQTAIPQHCLQCAVLRHDTVAPTQARSTHNLLTSIIVMCNKPAIILTTGASFQDKRTAQEAYT